jgi:hypothetical protein
VVYIRDYDHGEQNTPNSKTIERDLGNLGKLRTQNIDNIIPAVDVHGYGYVALESLTGSYEVR